MEKINLLEILLIAGVTVIGVLIIQFLIVSGKKSNKDAPHALGLPQGSVRAVLSLSLIVFFIFIALFFYIDSSDPAKSKLAERILTILGTLVIAVSSFYFGTKATEQGNKIAQDNFKKVNQANNASHDKNIPPSVIQEALAKHKDAWKKQYACIDVKLGKKTAGETEFDLNCIVFVVASKGNQANGDNEIPSIIAYHSQGLEYSIPTDVLLQENTGNFPVE